MKRIAYSLLLIFLLSCGSSNPSSHKRITVQFRDSIIKDYFLLAVRDSSLVIARYRKGNIDMDDLIAESQNVPLNKIEKIYDKGSGYPSSIVFPLLGCAACAECAATPIHFGSDGGGMTDAELKIVHQNQILFPFIGAVAGGLFGYYAFYRDKEISFQTQDDIKKFRMWYAIFPDREPPELRKIK